MIDWGMRVEHLKRLVLERLMRYFRFLSESTARKSVNTVTSAEIAQALDVDATQVRKDFAAIGLLGTGNVGFHVDEVCRAIHIALGFDQTYEAVLIGTGNLGGALLAYPGFAKYGLHIVAAFDNDTRRIGKRIAGCTVRHVRMLVPFVKKHKIPLAILTTPAGVSQELTDRLVAAGVQAIWNFTPGKLVAPPDVLVRSEHISRGLSELAYHLKRGTSLGRRRAADAASVPSHVVAAPSETPRAID
jgi:redox-sensing transcriptional repressor